MKQVIYHSRITTSLFLYSESDGLAIYNLFAGKELASSLEAERKITSLLLFFFFLLRFPQSYLGYWN